MRPSLHLLLILLLAGARGSAAGNVLAEPSGIDRPALVLGEFTLGRDAVVDGDTLKVEGLDTSLRLIGLDTEETFKAEGDRRAATADWAAYWEVKRASSPKPVKVATPLGEEAKAFAQKFFAGVTRVRLERDDPAESRDAYDRLLAYVFADRGWPMGQLQHRVRTGGHVALLHEVRQRQTVSRRARGRDERGEKEQARIWDPTRQHYTDYAERLAGGARAPRSSRDSRPRRTASPIISSSAPATPRPASPVSSAEKCTCSAWSATSCRTACHSGLPHPSQGRGLPLIFFAREVFAATRLADFGGELVRVRGTVTVYKSPKSDREQLQIVVEKPEQILTQPTWPPSAATPALP